MTNRAEYTIVAAITLAIAWPQQASAPRQLSAPAATFNQPFSTIAGIRELKDGRVVLLDTRETALHVIDLRAKTSVTSGRPGSGPGEFTLPLFLYALPGDTTAILDAGRYMQLTILKPDGTLGSSVSTIDSALSTKGFDVEATDDAGRFYTVSRGPDSATIVRWDRARSRRDSVAHISMRIVTPLSMTSQRGSGEGRVRVRSIGIVPPLYSLSSWAVAGDGRVAVVTPEPYRVTYFNVRGGRVQGPSIPVAVISVTDAEKEAYRIEKQQPVAGIGVTRDGQRTVSYAKRAYTEPEAWPAKLPAFYVKAARFAPDGMLWVERASRAGSPRLFDVIDRAGRVAYQLELPAGRKLVGFGAGVVYLARVDDDDLHYLEKYALPK